MCQQNGDPKKRTTGKPEKHSELKSTVSRKTVRAKHWVDLTLLKSAEESISELEDRNINIFEGRAGIN